MGRQYQDFTAYYNTFYNANKAFEDGLESITQSNQEVDRTRYLSIFPEPQSASNTQSFERAIDKSANLLREDPNSKWVDDALLLIGRSYFYQENYVGAAQKFREVIALESELEGEARFRLARTLIVTERYPEASEVLGAALDGTEDYGTWTARMHLVRGELYVRQERWEEAERALQQGIQRDLPGDVAGRAAFLLGQVRETQEKYEEAHAAYQQVPAYSPSYEVEFAAQLSAIELKGRLGNSDEAFEQLRALERDDKNYEKRGELALVRARLYRTQEQFDKATQALLDMLRDREGASGRIQGRLHYELATLYRDAYENFSRGAAHFDTAATSLGRPSSQGGQGQSSESQRPPWAPSDAGKQADQFLGLADRSGAVARMDSLLRLGRMSEAEFQSYLDQVRKQRQAQQQARAQEGSSQQSQFQSRVRQQGRPSQETDVAAETGSSEAGFLFHKDPTRVREGQRQFQQTWGDRPRVDNWRRRAAIRESSAPVASAEEDSPQEDPQASSVEASETSAEAGIDVSEVPRDSTSQAQMEADRAVAQYELANSLFRAAGRPDSAATWYRRIVEENSTHPVAKQALYALAEAHRAQGDTAVARQTYRRVIEEYPGTSYADRARERLGEAPSEDETEGVDARADSAYAHAYTTWQEGNPEAALDDFLSVAKTYPETAAAPRALLAAGILYGRQVHRDTSQASGTLLHRFLKQSSSTDTSAAVFSLGIDSSFTDPQATTRSQSIDTTDAFRSAMSPSSDEDAGSVVSAPESDTSLGINTSSEAGDSTSSMAPLRNLLAHLTEQYPGAPQADQARSLLRRLEQQQASDEPASRDSTVTPSEAEAMSVAEGRAGAPEEMGEAVEAPDTTQSNAAPSKGREERANEQTETDRDPLPAPASTRAEEKEAPRTPLDSSADGWTLLVQTFTDRDEAMTQLRTIEQELDDRWPVDVLADSTESPNRYRVVVGHFETERAASQGRDRLAERLPGQPELWTLSSQNEDF